MEYLNSTIKKYLDDLASNLPAPGGGSAAALVSCLGLSCLLMVANFTVGKKGYESVQEEIKNIINKLNECKNELEKYIDKDVQAYNEVISAYKLPKNTQTEIENRDKKIQSALKNAASVAFEIMKISHNSIVYTEKLLKIGNKNLITDIACGVLFLFSGIQAAKYNVIINLKNLKDSDFKQKIKKEIKKIMTDTKIISKKILLKIKI
jgi:formiminotetrahydrofolate cyclodeaminase